MRRISLLVLITSIFAFYGCEPACQNEILDSSLSPDGKMIAIVFSRNCGATTGKNFQVSIVKYGYSNKGPGNTLILDSAPPYSDIYKPLWKDNISLILRVPEGARLFKRKYEVDGVSIEYQ